jgi:hypothetical protein
MATYLSNELSNAATGLVTTIPVGYKPKATVYGARFKRMRATITLAGQTTSDILQFGTLPTGTVFAYGVLTSSASLSTSTLAIGTAASSGAYRAAATFTATDTPTMFGVTTAVAAADTASTSETVVIGTIATAALPSSGTLVVDIYYSAPN